MTGKPLRLIVTGASGRMGSRVAALAAADARFVLTACVFHKGRGESRGAAAIATEELAEHLPAADVVIDFSVPEAAVRFAAQAARAGKALVTGTTGLSAVQQAQLKTYAGRIPILQSPNFKIGRAHV